jgi:hypothetical protein
MYNEKSRKNLKPFTSNNQPKKKGRPKGSLSLTNEIKKVLEGVDETSKKQIKPVQHLFILMNIVTYKHEKSKITHFYWIS